jgi:hypothetical protein
VVKKALVDAKPKTFREAVVAVAKVLADPPKTSPELATVLGKGGPTDIPLDDAEKLFTKLERDQLTAIRKKIEAFKVTSPNAPPRAHSLVDGQVVQPVVFLRGNPGNRGPSVPRQAPGIVAGPSRKPFTEGSGRLELAKAIVSPDNPLTARVFVNRVWVGHFGQGLVRTPSDFGLRSDPPTHPELLDWLASTFMADGWSIKHLHKRIMFSATYQQSSTPTGVVAPGATRFEDPDNRLLSHQNRRRLDFEATRDSLLVAAGRLDPAIGGRPVELFKAPFPTRRSVYGMIDRLNLPGTFRVFDLANPDQHSPQRFQTTVPQQALFLLNSPFVVEQAKALAARPEIAAAKSTDERVTRLYRAVLSRNPTPNELSLGKAFIGPAEPTVKADAFGPLQHYAQVLLLSNEFAFVD